MTEAAKRTIIWTCSWMAYGKAPEEKDYIYWLGKFDEMVARGVEIGVPDYAQRRLRGWQAGGSDVALFGEFAQPPTVDHPVPPSPWLEDAPRPVIVPADDSSAAVLARIEAKQDAQLAALRLMNDALEALRVQGDANTEKIQQQLDHIVKDAETTLKGLAAAPAAGGLLKMFGFGK